MAPHDLPDDLDQRPSRRRVALLGTLFVLLVILISTWQHSLFVPIYLGIFTALKSTLGAWIKLATPKFFVALAKNSLAIKLRDVLVKAVAEVTVFTHRPWRRRVLGIKQAATDVCWAALRHYLAYPLWLRSLIAVGLLAITASSTWAVLALLIIPQPIINWLKLRATVILRKMGVLKLFDGLSRSLIPAPSRARWDRYRRWTLGRRQVRASRELRAQLAARVKPAIGSKIAPLLRRDRD